VTARFLRFRVVSLSIFCRCSGPFTIIPHRQMGLQASLPQMASPPVVVGPPETISVGLACDGSLWINQSAVKLDELRGFFLNVSWLSALIVLIFQGGGSLEFGAVAHVTVVRRFAAGLATSELEKNR